MQEIDRQIPAAEPAADDPPPRAGRPGPGLPSLPAPGADGQREGQRLYAILKRELDRAGCFDLSPWRGFAQMGGTLMAYLGDKLNQPVTGATRAGLAQILVSRNLPQELIDRLFALLAKSEEGRFASNAPWTDPDSDVLRETEVLISDLEKGFG